MNWPAINTDTLEDEAVLVNFLKGKTAKEIAAMEFWPGDYDDFSGALMLAGYTIGWIYPYYFTARHPKHVGTLQYIEGDLLYIPD